MSDEDYATRIWKLLLITLLVAFSLRSWLMMDAGTYKGKGFTIEFPEEWTEWDIPETVRNQQEGGLAAINTVTFLSPKTSELTDVREASITVISYKLDQAAWLEDEFPRIMDAVKRQGSHIVKDGEIKIDHEVSRWILHHDKKNKILNLEFYIITTANMFFKIHYAADDLKFKEHREAFEKAKSTFKITGFRL